MDLVSFLLTIYLIILFALAAAALRLQLARRGDKLCRALTVSAAAGIIVPLLTYFCYPLPAPAPPPRVEAGVPLLAQAGRQLAQSVAQAIGEALIRIIAPFFNGVVAIVGFFLFSLLLPCSGRGKAAE